MMKHSILTRIFSVALSLSVIAVLLTSCTSAQQDRQQTTQPYQGDQGMMMGPGQGTMRGPGMMPSSGRCGYGQGSMMSMVRHRYVMTNGIPDRYLAKHNPLPADQENIQAGAQLYQTYCAACHGSKGHGGGEAGKTFIPSPSNVAAAANRGMMASDPYLYWTIAEGGTQLKTAMPAFKDTLQEKQIWQIISYLHQLH